VGEFNRDGIQDLVTASGGTVGLLLGNGNGTFQPVINFPGAANPSGIAIGYFNPDAFQDLAVVASGGISVLLGNGDGTLQAPLFIDTGVPVIGLTRRSIAVGDFNRDGTEDLVASNAPAPSLAVLLGNGDGTFRAPLIIDAGGDGFSLAIGDFNSDRIQDLATTTSFPSPPGISVLQGNGNGTFRTPSFFSLEPGGAAGSIAVGDFNSDGIHDLAAASSSSVSVPFSNVSILLGTGAGTFQPPVRFLIGGLSSFSIATGRFNTDYRPDIAVSGSRFRGLLIQHKISVLINNTP
jgi:hypothetical protein